MILVSDMKKLNIFFHLFLICVFILSFTISVSAHPGRTDSNGGHYNRKTGEYHYHNGSSAGKNTGGDSDSYSYSHFEGPTTNYYYDSGGSSNSDSSYSQTTDTTQQATVEDTPNYLAIVFSILILGLISFFIIKKLFIVHKNKKLAKELKNKINDIENRKLELNRKSANILNQKISELKRKENELNKIYEKIKDTNTKEYYEYFLGKDSIENLSGFPSGIESYAGILFDTKFNEPYGRFTIYSTPGNKTIHTIKGCDGAFISHHILYNNLTDVPLCSKCATSKDKYYKDKIQFINSIGVPYEKYKNYQNIISMYDIKLPTTEKLDAYSVNGVRFEKLAGFPDGIFTDGFIVNDKKSNEVYGRLTVYLVNGSKTVHLTQGCCGAHTAANMARLSESIGNHRLCEQCGYNEKRFLYFNAEKWNRRFLRIKNSYKELLDNEQNKSEFF